jgi:hypothetical protein
LKETPRKRHRTATLEEQPVRSQPSVPSVPSVQLQDLGTCSLDGRKHLVLTGQPTQRANRCYPLLGHSLCQPAFKCLSGISGSMLWRAATYADQGLVTWKANCNHRKAHKRDEMRDAIWMVVVDLHEHSPFAKAEVSKHGGPVWHLPFHQKVFGLAGSCFRSLRLQSYVEQVSNIFHY